MSWHQFDALCPVPNLISTLSTMAHCQIQTVRMVLSVECTCQSMLASAPCFGLRIRWSVLRLHVCLLVVVVSAME